MNKWLKPLLKNYEQYFGKTDRPVVWEVGSRDGHDCVELARAIYKGQELWFWNYATLVCLEPNPDQAKIIRKNYPEVTVIEKAASNDNGFAPFKVYHGNEGDVGSSSLNLDWKGDDLEGHEIQVEITRLDKLIADTDEIDIMKIDVEGHSLEVLEGLGTKINQIKVFHIETETWSGSDMKVKAYMKARGFTLVDETEQYGGMPDQVWVRVG